MTKRELIDEILRRNATASPAFLARFEDKDLAEYLEHLNWVASAPAGPIAQAVETQTDAPPAESGQPAGAAPAEDGFLSTPPADLSADQDQGQQAPSAELPAVAETAAGPVILAVAADQAAELGGSDEPAYNDNVDPVEDAGQEVGVASESSLPFAKQEADESQTWMF